jgi:hypothetical protein
MTVLLAQSDDYCLDREEAASSRLGDANSVITVASAPSGPSMFRFRAVFRLLPAIPLPPHGSVGWQEKGRNVPDVSCSRDSGPQDLRPIPQEVVPVGVDER